MTKIPAFGPNPIAKISERHHVSKAYSHQAKEKAKMFVDVCQVFF